MKLYFEGSAKVDNYGVAFAINSCEESDYDSNFPQVCVCSSEEEAIAFAREYKTYRKCKDVIPFRNFSKRNKVNWAYIKKNKIVK